jgi:23S rRNA (adenine2503-C2)-methyltransferase
MKDPFCGLTYEAICKLMAESGFDEKQSLKAVTNFYRRRLTDFSAMDNLPKALRDNLGRQFDPALFSPVKYEESSDGSVKYLFMSGENAFETVFIPEGRRKTICVSTQSGCRMGCPFCLTGRNGFKGNLSAGDIINQVMSVPLSREITHVVFMGMGEPLDNLEALLKACRVLTASWGLAISPANITVSTVGITPAVETFLNESNCNLTLSLYSPFPDERASIVPAERHYPAEGILNLMKKFPALKKRRFSIAYIMIKDINDTDSHLYELVKLLKGTSIRVNLLNYHPVGDDPIAPSTAVRMDHFRQKLTVSGISASVRKSRGNDISAACGLLATNKYIQ